MSTWRGEAGVLREIKQPFSIEEVELLPLDPTRVVVKTHASPFCSTDVKNWKGQLYKIPPTVLGHASIGEVVEVGSAVSGLRVGQRVVVPGTPECGACYYCSIGEPWQCGELFDLGGIYPDVARGDDGALISCAGCVGGYAEYMSISGNQVFPVESELPSDVLSMLGCGISTGVGSVFNVARVQPGESVAIVGAGHLGLWMLQAARIAGAGTVVVVEPHEGRRELAGALGADVLVDPGTGAGESEALAGALAAVREATGGRGADVVLEAAGPAVSQSFAVQASRRGGRTVLTGFEIGGATLPLPQVETALQSRRILSSQNGQVHMKSDLQRYTGLLERGLLDPAPILTRRYPLAELDLARDNSAALTDVCGVIVFDH
ncbi:alcohol dehydrogenase catalytic domain-containing protein [Herbiconiux moechotypicola]|uniref:Zinc-dependent alcohol dehydrogenase family protein n=1 Tax=Herbiconiux moechotypicola TaxID=637393 RepID=A0ABN3DYA4_9MICO|nr:alcohol dehydrogenase catalytic domain-containing protein [Herbiconiux moechotypicola]MCS5730822.1 alcohol dehydrogenase catalytic domain-containing protein [Herbiconiux moechotypicola]